MRRSKANSKANTTKNKKGKPINHYNPNDTLSYASGNRDQCNTLKVIFFKKDGRKNWQTDTLRVGFDHLANLINELDQVQLNGYIYKNEKTTIFKIKLCDCDKKNESDFTRSLYLQRATTASKYFKLKGFSKRKIELE